MKQDQYYSDIRILKYWAEFEAVSVNEDDELEADFYFFPKGTPKTEVWQWFDSQYSKGVHALIYGESNESKFSPDLKIELGPRKSEIKFEKFVCPIENSKQAKKVIKVLELRGYRLKSDHYHRFTESIFSDEKGNVYFSNRSPQEFIGEYKAVSIKDICGDVILNKDFVFGLCSGIIFMLILKLIMWIF